MTVSESAHAAWQHDISRNRTDATDHSLTEMSSDEPLDFSLKKRVRRDAPEMDWAPPAAANPLLKSYLEGTRSAFEPVVSSRASHMPVSPFLANFLRSGPVATPTSTTAKSVRPFKAYNPMDPASALGIGYGLGDISPLPFHTGTDLAFLGELQRRRKSASSSRSLNQRSHSVPSQANNKGQPQAEVSSSTATPPGCNTAIDLSPAASTRENSNSPTSTSDLTRSQAVKREHSPTIDVMRYSPDHKSDSGSSSDSHGPAAVPTPSFSAGSLCSLASRARRRGQSMPDELKDNTYWERRRKNNEAAKRSRDSRRAKEDEIAMRAAYLEQENIKLRIEVAALRAETDKLRHLLLSS